MMWKINPNFPDYEVSSSGSVRRCVDSRSYRSGRLIKSFIGTTKYPFYTLKHKNGKFTKVRKNRLVCETFHGPAPTNLHEAAHLNGIVGDDRENNLQWKTKQENEDDKKIHATRPIGDKVYNAILNDELVRQIRQSNMSVSALSHSLGISRGAIHAVLSRASWKHVE